MQRVVAEMMEGVEEMGKRMTADRSRVNLLHANTDLQLVTLGVEMRNVMREQVGGVGRGMEQLQQQLGSLPVQLRQLSERARGVDGVMSEQLHELRHVSERMDAGLGAVEEQAEEVKRRVMEGMRASQMRDVAEMEEMVELHDQISAMGEQMSVMSKQLGLLPSQLRLLGRQCDEVKGQLGRLADEQAVMGRRVEEVQRGVKEQLEEIGQGQRDMLR